jgi:hypothetical protein
VFNKLSISLFALLKRRLIPEEYLAGESVFMAGNFSVVAGKRDSFIPALLVLEMRLFAMFPAIVFPVTALPVCESREIAFPVYESREIAFPVYESRETVFPVSESRDIVFPVCLFPLAVLFS